MPTLKKTVRRPWMPERGAQEGRSHPNTKFYQSKAWRELRAVKLDRFPLCEECQRRGVTTLAKMVDHIVPINKGGAPLDLVNLQSLCHPCHNRKSGGEAQKNKRRDIKPRL